MWTATCSYSASAPASQRSSLAPSGSFPESCTAPPPMRVAFRWRESSPTKFALNCSPERVDGELRAADQTLGVEDDEVCPRSEVVAPGEVTARIGRRHAFGEAARLENPVVRARIAQRGVPAAVQEPELREQ